MCKLRLALGTAFLLLPIASAYAEVGTVDNVPAATLLLPMFEVDTSSPSARTTQLSIKNASAAPFLTQVTLWTDMGVPTYAFNIYLTGFDSQLFDLRSLFDVALGTPPQTSAESNQGSASETNVDFPDCGGDVPNPGDAPLLPPPALSAAQISALANAHRGQPSDLLSGLCGANDHGDDIHRGYVTIDVVNRCSTLFPGDSDYFISGGNGVAANSNVLWGHYRYVDAENNFAQGETLVHIEADAGDARLTTAGNYTFYGRHIGASAADNREPLATAWVSPYARDETELIVWRDLGRTSPFACGIPPAPADQLEIVAFDNEENPSILAPAVRPFPYAASRTAVGSGELPIPHKSGWMWLNLNTTAAGSPFTDPDVAQSHVTVVRQIEKAGRFSGAHSAIQLDNALEPRLTTITTE